MADFEVRITGHAHAQRVLEHLRDGGRAVSDARVRVGSPLQYAPGIETGRTRGGRVARAAGGLHFLERGLDHAAKRFDKGDFAQALEHGAAATVRAIVAFGHDVEAAAKQLLSPFPYSPRTKRRTGSLRRSVITVSSGRPTVVP